MDFVQSLQPHELLIFAAIGLAVLFFGYRIKKIAFFIIWFLLGFNLVRFLLPTIENIVPEIAGSELYKNLLPIAGGLLLGLLGFSIEKLCVGGIAFTLTMMIIVCGFQDKVEMQTLAVGAVIGVIAAGAAVTLMKPAIIVATSAAGAYAITLVIISLASNFPFETYYWPFLIILTIIGSIVQFRTTKGVS